MKHLSSVIKSWDELIHKEAFSRSKLLKNIDAFNKNLLKQFPLPKYNNAAQFCFSQKQGSLRTLRNNYLKKIQVISKTARTSRQRISENALSKIPKRSHIFVLDDRELAHVLSEAKKQKKATIHSITKLKTSSKTHKITMLRQVLKGCDLVLLSASAVTNDKVIDIVGSELVAATAKSVHIPVFIVTTIMNTDFNNFFMKNLSKGNDYELIDPNLVTGIISEIGIYDHYHFTEQAKNTLTS